MYRWNNRAWITANEALCLEKYAKLSAVDIVELGTFRAGSTEIMAKARPNVPVWTVDLFLDEYLEYPIPGERVSNPAELRNKYLEDCKNVNIIIADTHALGYVWAKPIGLLFIDGNHSEVEMDWKAWNKHIISKGYVIFHDAVGSNREYLSINTFNSICHPCRKVEKVAELVEKIKQSNEFFLIEEVDTMAVFQKFRD